MHIRVAQGIVACEENEPCSSDDGCQNSADRQSFLNFGSVVCQTTLVSKPSFGDKGEVEDYDRDCTASDKEWFQALRSNITDICYALSRTHRRIMWSTFS